MLLYQRQALPIAPALARALADGTAEEGALAVLEELLYLARRYEWVDVLAAVAAVADQKERALADPPGGSLGGGALEAGGVLRDGLSEQEE